MEHVLSDEEFRSDLERTGLERAQSFSWDLTANRAITALEQARRRVSVPVTPTSRPKLAYVSPLPPTPSGISDYSAELIPELARTYDITLIVADGTAPANSFGCRVETADWLREHRSEFERVLYQFGNSEFHQHMFELLDEVPGVVVLHDFFLSSIIAYMEITGQSPGFWSTALYESHGYHAVLDRVTCTDIEDVVWKYPTNLRVLQRAEGIIVHSQYSCRLADAWYGVRHLSRLECHSAPTHTDSCIRLVETSRQDSVGYRSRRHLSYAASAQLDRKS